MNTTDWKDALANAFNVPVPDENQPEEPQQPADRGDAVEQQGKARLDIVLEKKGRGGKQARPVAQDAHAGHSHQP